MANALREKLARIDQVLTDARRLRERTRVDIERIIAERDRCLEMRYQPGLAIFTGMGAAAAFFAAGVAFGLVCQSF